MGIRVCQRRHPSASEKLQKAGYLLRCLCLFLWIIVWTQGLTPPPSCFSRIRVPSALDIPHSLPEKLCFPILLILTPSGSPRTPEGSVFQPSGLETAWGLCLVPINYMLPGSGDHATHLQIPYLLQPTHDISAAQSCLRFIYLMEVNGTVCNATGGSEAWVTCPVSSFLGESGVETSQFSGTTLWKSWLLHFFSILKLEFFALYVSHGVPSLPLVPYVNKTQQCELLERSVPGKGQRGFLQESGKSFWRRWHLVVALKSE